jgi:hypothetical protein
VPAGVVENLVVESVERLDADSCDDHRQEPPAEKVKKTTPRKVRIRRIRFVRHRHSVDSTRDRDVAAGSMFIRDSSVR